MRKIEKIVTNDGVEHSSEREARKHCEEMLGKYLCEMASKLIHVSGYSQILELLETNLEPMHLAYLWQVEGKGAVTD